MTHYIHNINPIVLPLWGDFAVRWYGLSYLASFMVAILLLRRWSRKGEFEVPEKEVGNFIVLLAFFGVFLGGRLGFMLLYGLSSLLSDPLSVFRVWEGGMSSHGGFVGVVVFMVWYARKNRHRFWNLADHMACVTSVGFTFGRLANFINGELWGRITTVPWAVVFPQSVDASLQYGDYSVEQIRALDLPARHPSQLYQAACEGLLLFGIMMLLRKTRLARTPGLLSACYLALYAVARIGMEFFREPDNGEFFIAWISKGQFYSVLMLLCAAGIALYIKRFKPNPQDAVV